MMALSHYETAENYARVIAWPAPGWRVVVCKDGVQCVAHRREKGGAERPWRAVGYIRTRKAIIRLCGASCGQIDPAARRILDALPETFDDTPFSPRSGDAA